MPSSWLSPEHSQVLDTHWEMWSWHRMYDDSLLCGTGSWQCWQFPECFKFHSSSVWSALRNFILYDIHSISFVSNLLCILYEESRMREPEFCSGLCMNGLSELPTRCWHPCRMPGFSPEKQLCTFSPPRHRGLSWGQARLFLWKVLMKCTFKGPLGSCVRWCLKLDVVVLPS